MSITEGFSSTADRESQITEQLRGLSEELRRAVRYDLLLDAITVPALQQLNIEAAKERLSPLEITSDYRFLLPRYEKEVDLSPINKALYIFFLNHEEGIEFKRLSDYRDELMELYRQVGNRVSDDIIRESIDRLVNPLDNSINEKCARIKSAFAKCMDSYQLNYYAISKHSVRQVEGFSRIWYDRRRTITLPRELVVYDGG